MLLVFLSPETKSCGLTNQAKATEYFLRAVLFLYHTRVMVLTFDPVDKILKCNHSMKAGQQYFPVVLFIVLCKVVLAFESADKCKMRTFN